MAGTVDTGPIASFVRIDLAGAIIGLTFVVVANGFYVREPLVWVIAPPLVLLIASLSIAGRTLPGNHRSALALVTVGNWIVAVVVAILLPFLWPAMILTVLLPLVLATPYLDRRTLPVAVSASAMMTTLVGAVGLLRDGGSVAGIHENFEFGLVIGGLGALTVPIALLIRQNNALQRSTIDELATSRRRIVEAADIERRRIERDLHDGAQQRLLALGMRMRLLASKIDPDAAELGRLVDELVDETDLAVDELRTLAQGIYPPLLAARGLSETLAATVRSSPFEIEARIEPVGRHEPAVESAIYFTALEALANTAKHAPGSATWLELRHEHDSGVVLVVADDGPGFEPSTVRSAGLVNMNDRIGATNGVVTITSNGNGTVVRAVVPTDAGGSI